MSDTKETIGGRRRVGPEDEAREDQMDNHKPGPAEKDEDELGMFNEDAHGIEESNDLRTP
ncbi:hypothetical protein [Aureimonas glaciei]|uniref:Uncharacterized protein n=1 Tax=Aureimonas glaciei TaxID=1776957 RepID=A0A916Y4C4_9HYPH|nr:hypothetical protein [Aureimonas glaciei]GGD29122.1 hypothetical protein GCM10011335_35330 [Aureimonas glaciei]